MQGEPRACRSHRRLIGQRRGRRGCRRRRGRDHRFRRPKRTSKATRETTIASVLRLRRGPWRKTAPTRLSPTAARRDETCEAQRAISVRTSGPSRSRRAEVRTPSTSSRASAPIAENSGPILCLPTLANTITPVTASGIAPGRPLPRLAALARSLSSADQGDGARSHPKRQIRGISGGG